MVWRSGKPNIKIRKAGVLCLSKLLQKRLIEPNQLHQIYPEILPCLKNCLDDDWAPDLRYAAIKVSQQIVEYIKDELDYIELSGLYPILLTRMDDAQDTIRIETAAVMRIFFGCKNLSISDSTFEYVTQTLFIHLDDKNEDVQMAVYKTIEFAAEINPKIVYAEALKSKPKQKFPRL